MLHSNYMHLFVTHANGWSTMMGTSHKYISLLSMFTTGRHTIWHSLTNMMCTVQIYVLTSKWHLLEYTGHSQQQSWSYQRWSYPQSLSSFCCPTMLSPGLFSDLQAAAGRSILLSAHYAPSTIFSLRIEFQIRKRCNLTSCARKGKIQHWWWHFEIPSHTQTSVPV